MPLTTINSEAFERELTVLINKYSVDAATNTPDYILARYLVSCAEAFQLAIAERQVHHGRPESDIRAVRTGMKL